uniref:NADH dehydrogenase [ubiquinone] 1 subunit C1, mitochondrial n=1 Tax=Suricata suricatta TaxID=37032 RepID=A0A673VJK8_SURSU
MAPRVLLHLVSKLLDPARLLNYSLGPSKFYIQLLPHDRSDWLKVGLTLRTSIFLWIYFVALDLFIYLRVSNSLE